MTTINKSFFSYFNSTTLIIKFSGGNSRKTCLYWYQKKATFSKIFKNNFDSNSYYYTNFLKINSENYKTYITAETESNTTDDENYAKSLLFSFTYDERVLFVFKFEIFSNIKQRKKKLKRIKKNELKSTPVKYINILIE
jgi:hypothetical protein